MFTRLVVKKRFYTQASEHRDGRIDAMMCKTSRHPDIQVPGGFILSDYIVNHRLTRDDLDIIFLEDIPLFRFGIIFRVHEAEPILIVLAREV